LPWTASDQTGLLASWCSDISIGVGLPDWCTIFLESYELVADARSSVEFGGPHPSSQLTGTRVGAESKCFSHIPCTELWWRASYQDTLPRDVANVVLNVTSTKQDGSADGLLVVLDVFDDDCTEPEAVEDEENVFDLVSLAVVEVRAEVEEPEDADDLVIVASVAVDEMRPEMDAVEDVGSVVEAVSVAITPMVVVYVLIVSLVRTVVILTLVRVIVTVSFVPVQSIGTYGDGVNPEG
jgi:hypothetical protein